MTTIQKLREVLALALSFVPKGPVPQGLDPTFYYTLSYEGDRELKGRIDEAWAVLEELDKLKPLSEQEVFQEYWKWGIKVSEGEVPRSVNSEFLDTFTAGVRAAEKRLMGEV